MKDIAIYGAGGFGREVACLINKINAVEPTWNLVGFFDDTKAKGETISHFGVVLGNMDDLNGWDKDLSVAIAIGSPLVLRSIVERVNNEKISFPNIISPDTLFLDVNTVNIGKGNIICSRCLVSCDVTIGNFNIFNGYIPVGHDSHIGNYNVVMPSVNISGGVTIGDNNFFGVQSVVLQYMKVEDNVRIGAASVVMRTAKSGNLYMGNPATKVKL